MRAICMFFVLAITGCEGVIVPRDADNDTDLIDTDVVIETDTVETDLVEDTDVIETDSDSEVDTDETIETDITETDAADTDMNPLFVDNDGDGRHEREGDCDDNNADVYPGAVESCDNSIDDDCDRAVNEGCGSEDTDVVETDTQPPDDTDVFETDEPEHCFELYRDVDGDMYGAGPGVEFCESDLPITGYMSSNDDCNDRDPDVNPEAAEICNGVDDDCDGSADDGLNFREYYRDADADGFGNLNDAFMDCKPPSAPGPWVFDSRDCDDAVDNNLFWNAGNQTFLGQLCYSNGSGQLSSCTEWGSTTSQDLAFLGQLWQEIAAYACSTHGAWVYNDGVFVSGVCPIAQANGRNIGFVATWDEDCLP